MATFKDIIKLVDEVSEPLKKIGKAAENTTQKTNKLSEKVKKLNDTMNNMRPALNKAWGGVVKFGQAFAGLVGSSGLITMGIAKVTDFADNIDKMSQKIGMSTDEYQKWNYIMSINGGNVDSLAMGFKTLTTQIEGVQKGSKDSIKAFNSLGIKVKDNTGKFRKQEDIFNDSITALQKIENVTKRDILANRLFGRSASELRPLLNQSADAVDELAKNFEKYGMKLSKEEIENATQFKDTWTTFTMFLQAQTNKALTELLPKLQGILNKIMEHKKPIQDIIKGLGQLAIKVFDVIDYLDQHKALLSFILGIIAGLGAMTLYANITAGIASVTAAMTALGVTSSIALGGIPILIGLVTAGLTALVMNWDKVKATASTVASAVSNAWGNLVNKFQGWISKMVGWLDALLEKLGFLAYFIPALSGLKLGKNIAGAISNRINQNSVKQSSVTNTTTNQTTNNNYFGNTYNNMPFNPLASSIYSL